MLPKTPQNETALTSLTRMKGNFEWLQDFQLWRAPCLKTWILDTRLLWRAPCLKTWILDTRLHLIRFFETNFLELLLEPDYPPSPIARPGIKVSSLFLVYPGIQDYFPKKSLTEMYQTLKTLGGKFYSLCSRTPIIDSFFFFLNFFFYFSHFNSKYFQSFGSIIHVIIFFLLIGRCHFNQLFSIASMRPLF